VSVPTVETANGEMRPIFAAVVAMPIAVTVGPVAPVEVSVSLIFVPSRIARASARPVSFAAEAAVDFATASATVNAPPRLTSICTPSRRVMRNWRVGVLITTKPGHARYRDRTTW